jgi:hypothetical protein
MPKVVCFALRSLTQELPPEAGAVSIRSVVVEVQAAGRDANCFVGRSAYPAGGMEESALTVLRKDRMMGLLGC